MGMMAGLVSASSFLNHIKRVRERESERAREKRILLASSVTTRKTKAKATDLCACFELNETNPRTEHVYALDQHLCAGVNSDGCDCGCGGVWGG
jgi:hypothetical protein